MRKTIWKLTAGEKDGQQTREEKLARGKEYIEKLKKEDKVKEVIEEEDKLIIILE